VADEQTEEEGGMSIMIVTQQYKTRQDARSPLFPQLRHQYQRLAGRRTRRSLINIAVCFRDQAAMLPLQCQETIARLDDLRRVAQTLQACLDTLDPTTTRRVKPFASIDKLAVLDWQLTEIILCVAMLWPICQWTGYERIDLHLTIRSRFPRLLATYEDTLSQVAALLEQECYQQDDEEREEEAYVS
jgi:hypothetical protein